MLVSVPASARGALAAAYRHINSHSRTRRLPSSGPAAPIRAAKAAVPVHALRFSHAYSWRCPAQQQQPVRQLAVYAAEQKLIVKGLLARGACSAVLISAIVGNNTAHSAPSKGGGGQHR